MRIPELYMNIMLYYYFTPSFPRKDEKSMLSEIRPSSARWCLITKPEDHNILKRSPDTVNNLYTGDSGKITTATRFIQASLCKIQGLFKDFFQDFPTVFKV